ncbi:hypothetical protein [Celeribacter sp.]|uniref:hypothetical protein n=1 Tax=Celeribacter sp. TaxID=1890673 RepID=UPI003A901024
MFTKAVSTTAVLFALSTPAFADPTVGFGLNFTFGNGSVDTGVGVRMFSNDERDKAAASVGLDYMFGSQSLRGSLGAAYMMDNSYIELNGGYDFGSGEFDFGIGGGITEDAGSSDDSWFGPDGRWV